MPAPVPPGLLAPPPEGTGPQLRPTDLFHFHPRSTNPELWRTTVPLVVRERCKRHKGLVATWTAIHWLIVLHAASGRAHFGMREIAEEAGVGRNELAGPVGHIQRLVDLGLLRIVGYKSFRGLREPRPVYSIDLRELERLSLDLVPDILRERHIDRPPPAAPDPRQLRLEVLPDDGEPAGHPWPQQVTGAAPLLAGRPPAGRATPENGTAARLRPQAGGPEGPGLPEDGTAAARKRDMEGRKERTREGAGQPLAPDLLHELVAQTTIAVIAALQPQLRQTTADAPAVLTQIPPAPGAAGRLDASVLALWQGEGPDPRQRDIQQLALLAREYDGPTGGHGAYWLGRAILMADLCLGGEQPVTIAYVRRVLRRWCDEGSWGSDREGPEPTTRANGATSARAQAGPELLPAAVQQHPAVQAYVEALREAPNATQAAQIAETVADLAVWRQVLTDWRLNGWGERSVGKMLDRYRKTAPGAAPPEAPPSVAAIHTYPGLSMEQRERWIRAFHAAGSPAEKRAVLARLAQEHPQ